MPDPFLVHCHIPKTGGSALNRRFLYPALGERYVYQLYRYVFERASRIPTRHVSRAMRSHAATGHVPFGFFDRVYPEALYFSVFREPIERMVSFLNFVLANPEHKVNARLPQQAVLNASDDPDAYVAAVLAEPRLQVVQANVQTRIAGGAARLGDRPVGHEHLAQALENLSHRRYLVGHQSDLDGFIDGLSQFSGLRFRPKDRPTESNARLEKRLPRVLRLTDLKPRTIDMLRAANDLDLALCDSVAERQGLSVRKAA